MPALDKAYTEFLTADAKNRELKAKQEAEIKAAIDKAAAEKIIQDAKLEAEKIIQDAKIEAEKIIQDAKAAAEKVAASTKKVTITCTKGKITKKVTAVKPKCPAGYKKK